MNQEVLYHLFEQATTAIVIYQQQQGICYLNPRARALLDTDRDHMHARSLQELFPAHQNQALLERLQHDRKSFSYQNATLHLRDTSYLYADLGVHALTSAGSGSPTYQLNIYPKNLKAPVAEEEKELQPPPTTALLDVMRQQTKMPLSALENLLHRLLEQTPRKDQLPLIHSMLHSGESLKSTVQDILLYSQLLYGKYQPKHEDFTPWQIINDLRSHFSTKAAQQGTQLVISASISRYDRYQGDQQACKQIIHHLLDNAVRFTQNGLIKVGTSTEAIDHDRQVLVHIVVKDNGPGISEELLEKAKEPFVSKQPSWEQNNHHSGLGLSIVQLLATKCGGSFNLQSTSAGTEAKVSLPYTRISVSEITPAIQTQPTNPLQGLRLLYVEDLLPNHFLMEGLCAIWNISLDTAFNGQEAIGKFYNNPYDIILMDLNMPLMNGYDASREIRNATNLQKRSVPIIAVTGSISREARVSIRDHGIDDILSKPIQPDELYKKLTTYANI